MHDLSIENKQIISTGVSQKERYNHFLNPDYFKIDEFDFKQFIVFIASYSKGLAYFNDQNKMDGDWGDFFEKDPTLSLLRLTTLDTKQLKSNYFEVNKVVSTNKDINFSNSRNKEFTINVIQLFIEIDKNIIQINSFQDLQDELIYIIEQNLAQINVLLFAYLQKIDSKKLYLKNELNNYWFLKEAPSNPNIEVDVPLIESLLTNLINSLQLIKRTCDKFYQSKIAGSGTIEPQIALLLTFHKLYGYASVELNKVTGRHLDFYYKEVLKIDALDNVPNSVFLTFEVKSDESEVEIKKGTLLTAGSNDEGVDVLYEISDSLLVNNAEITKQVLFDLTGNLERDKVISNTEIEFDFFQLDSSESVLTPENTFGFSFSSHFLSLEEGHRKIDFKLFFEKNNIEDFLSDLNRQFPKLGLKSNLINSYIKDLFVVQFSSDKEWITLKTDSVETSIFYDEVNTYAKGIEIKTFVSSIEPSVGILEGENTEPEFRFCLNSKHKEILFIANRLKLSEIIVSVDILDIQNLLLSNDFGILDQNAPFQPFGTEPVLGSSFYVGHKTLFNYPLSDLKLNIEWYGLPLIEGGFEEYYRGYHEIEGIDSFKATISALKEKNWCPEEDKQITDLFQNIPDSDFNTIAPLRRVNEFNIRSLQLHEVSVNKINDDIFSTNSISGFLKFELCYPLTSFGHDQYADLVREAAIKSIKNKNVEYPNEPYTPTIKEISAELSSSIKFSAFNKETYTIKHISPLGISNATLGDTLMPDFKNGSTLFLGISKLFSNNLLSLLFKFNDTLISNEIKVQYSVYDGKNWLNLSDDDILSDTTEGFKKDGIVKLDLNKAIPNIEGVFGDDNRWIKIESKNASSFLEDLLDIIPHATLAVCKSQELLEKENIDSFQITDFLEEIEGIDNITQKYPSFGGFSKEESESLYSRISERLKHKNRAVGSDDYEKIILQRFKNVHRCICFKHRNSEKVISPGNVLLTVVPSLGFRNEGGFKGFFSSFELKEMEAYLKSKVPFGTKFDVVNPSYEKIRTKFNVRFRDGYDSKYYLTKLNKEIKAFISPFIFAEGVQLEVAEKFQSTQILNFIENLEYVEHVLNFKMFHIVNEKIINHKYSKAISFEIVPSSMTSILITDDNHDISLYDEESATDKAGINEMMIETDYVVDMANNPNKTGLNSMIIGQNYKLSEEGMDNREEKSNFIIYLNLD